MQIILSTYELYHYVKNIPIREDTGEKNRKNPFIKGKGFVGNAIGMFYLLTEIIFARLFFFYLHLHIQLPRGHLGQRDRTYNYLY